MFNSHKYHIMLDRLTAQAQVWIQREQTMLLKRLGAEETQPRFSPLMQTKKVKVVERTA